MSPKIEFDELQMYWGYDYTVNKYIKIHQPTVGEIVRFGERKYFNTVNALTCIPSDMKSALFDAGIDYEEISDFELFALLACSLTVEDTSILFGDFDFSQLTSSTSEDGSLCLKDMYGQTIIDQLAYLKISGYLRKLHNITPKIEKAATKTVKRILIQLDRDRINEAKKNGYKSNLRPLVSAMMRYPGFKYKKNELDQCGFCEFMDTVYGAQIYVNSSALLQGAYSGMIDTKKINKKEFNPLRDF